MKKLMILFAMLVMASVNVFSQQIVYRCTNDNVNVRKGPSANYGKIPMEEGWRCRRGGDKTATLDKGMIVRSDGKQQNGFIHIEDPGSCWMISDGWVSAQFLVKAVKCSACNGKGNTGRRCPYHPGDIHEVQCVRCGGSGLEQCEECWGEGYK